MSISFPRTFGPLAGNIPLSYLDDNFTAVNNAIGVAAGNLVALDGSAKLPAVDGSQLTNMAAVSGVSNGLINGGHEVWQRLGIGGATTIAAAASATTYGADRWCITTGVNQASTISQSAGSTSASQYSGVVQRNNGQTGTGIMTYEQPFELSEIVKWRGRIIYISCVVATGGNWSPTSGTLTLSILCGTGAARARGLSGYTGETTQLTVTTNLAPSSGATTISGTASSVIPTTTTQMTLMFSWTPTGTAGANDLFTVDDVMWSASPGAPFERRIVSEELVMCQRYLPSLNVTGSSLIIPQMGYTSSTAGGYVYPIFPVTARIAPTGITVGTLANLSASASNGANSVLTALTFSSAGLNAGQLAWGGTGTPYTANMPAFMYATGATTLLFTGCEL
jgi:hypothetical protein